VTSAQDVAMYIIGAIAVGLLILVPLLVLFSASGQLPPGPILPQIPQERIPCHTMNEYEFSPYRCYEI